MPPADKHKKEDIMNFKLLIKQLSSGKDDPSVEQFVFQVLDLAEVSGLSFPQFKRSVELLAAAILAGGDFDIN